MLNRLKSRWAARIYADDNSDFSERGLAVKGLIFTLAFSYFSYF